MEYKLNLEHLPSTWFFDLDGVIVEHNGYKNGFDVVIPETVDTIRRLKKLGDTVIITTARDAGFKNMLEQFFHDKGIPFDLMVFNLPTGSRIVVNDEKPDGTKTAYASNIKRNSGFLL